MNAKTKKILSTIAALLVVAILAFLYLKNNGSGTQDPDPRSTEFTLDTLSTEESESPFESDTEEPSETEKKTTEATEPEETKNTKSTADDDVSVDKNGTYTDKEHVAAYIHKYGCLPSNYITKNKAEDLGWVSSKGNLNKVAPGKSIGGDKFGNYEKLLPTKKGRQYYECDIDYKKGSRNAKRIIYSNDGLIYYTSDHYESFTLLYGEE